MKTIRFFILIQLFFAVHFSVAQSKKQLNDAEELFKNTKEIYFQFSVGSRSELHELTKIISIDNVQGLTVKAFANKERFVAFLAKNYSYTILKKPNEAYTGKKRMMVDGQTLKSARAVGAYPTYPQYVSMMQQFAIDYPTLCTFHDLGTLPSGRKIVAVRISDNPGVHENEPEFLYTSTMHGDETAGYPMMLSLIEHILENYGTNPKITNLVNNCEIWINPLGNPDGAYAAGDLNIFGATRYNANGVDLNRNYPDPQDDLHPDGESYQAETQIFMDFAEDMDFVMSANFHGGAEVANYPWDTWNTNHADLNWWVQKATEYADSCQAHGSAGYMDDLYSGSIPGVTNGYDWYEVNGGRQDYMQWWHQCKEFTIELSTDKLLSETLLEDHFNFNLPSLLNYIEASLYGIRGIVTDQCTGEPIRAKVFVSGHDFDSSFVYSSLPVGNYHRPIYPGTYTVTYSAPGYQSVTVSGITVASHTSTTIQNIQLQPLTPVANFTTASIGGCDGTVTFTDLTGSASGWLWNFGDGNTSTDQNPTHTYATGGTYTVTLTASNCIGSDTETKPSYLTLTVATAPVTVNDSSSTCAPAALTLTASGAGTLAWYTAATGGTLVNTGTSYTTPVLSTTTAYYVESQNAGAPQYAGPADNTIGAGGYFTGASSHYEIFDAYQPFTLVSVKVYANSAGSRTIQLRNSGGTVLQSTTVTLPTGMSVVSLNFNVPAGTDLQLGISGTGGNLYRNSSGAAYPYTVPGIVSITRSSANPPNDLIYYYFFYNWEIATTCNSARTPVYAVINGLAGIADISIATPDNSICSGTSVTFTATPTSGGTSPTYQWQINGNNTGTNSPTFTSTGLNNSDVVTCILTSSDPCVTDNVDSSNTIAVTVFSVPTTPVINFSGSTLVSSTATNNQWYLNGTPIGGATSSTFTPVSNGTYYTIVTDANGCVSDTSNQIVLTSVGLNDIEINGFTLYPNPAKNSFTVQTNFTGNYTLSLFDQIGQKVMVKNCTKSVETVLVEQLRAGVYFVQINAQGYSKTIKLMIN